MRKISKTRSSNRERNTFDADLVDKGQGRIPGATITSWPAPDIDLDAFFARSGPGATVTGAAPGEVARADRPAEGTVSLSDGTRITFATTGQFDIEELV
jgi:hypothetical protein